MGISIVPVPSSASTPALSVGVPVGLTLRNTYTSTTSGLSFPVSQVYAILVGGGGGGSYPSYYTIYPGRTGGSGIVIVRYPYGLTS